MKHYLTIAMTLTFFISCTNVRQISNGNLSDNETYNFYFYNYIYVNDNNKKLFKNCKVFMTHIKNHEKKLKENIFWYSCDTILPIKVFMTIDPANGLDKFNFLVADTTDNYIFPISNNEREVFKIMNGYFAKQGYPTYSIKGFKNLTRQDSLARAPFLKTTIGYYKK